MRRKMILASSVMAVVTLFGLQHYRVSQERLSDLALENVEALSEN